MVNMITQRINPQLIKRAVMENPSAIREVLDILSSNALIRVAMTKEDHRYHQGYLQALGELVALITKP